MTLGISAFCVYHTRFKLLYFEKSFHPMRIGIYSRQDVYV